MVFDWLTMVNSLLKKLNLKILIGLVTLSLAFIFTIFIFFLNKGSEQNKPLYWVAPMDPNFRRDGPGKSPMGMDLVPVYEESSEASEPGVVKLSSQLQNQLGVRTETVEEGRLNQTLRTYGRVAFDQTLVSKLSPRVEGWVDMLFVSVEGESVKRGQPVYALYSKELVDAQQQYLNALSSATSSTIRKVEDELRALNVDDQVIEQIKRERVVQRSVVFYAPKDGVVGMLKVSEDDFVEPGDLVMSIGSLETVWAELNIFASQVSLIQPRQLITLSTPSYPGVTWDAEVDYIYPALNSQERSLLFRANIENPMMQLKPNMHLQGFIQLDERELALLIPRQTVIDLGDQTRVVLALGEGKFKSVEVVLGETDNEYVEVIEGLEEGDKIVSSAHFLIDSESSKTSDFRRMLSVEDDAPKYPVTWVGATIKEIDLVQRKIRLNHDYIEDWKMPSMTMNFQASDEFEFKGLSVGQRVEVKIADGEPLFMVQDVIIKDPE